MNLFLALAFCVGVNCDYTPAQEQIAWAHVIAGEAGNYWWDGEMLVAWTLRARWLHGRLGYGDPARWGWYGWDTPTARTLRLAHAVWYARISDSPYA